jgi:hypothetical protein
MEKLRPVLIALLVIIGFGVGIIYWRHRHHQIGKPWAANPCPNGLASVDNSIQPTLRINLLETNCEDGTASVHFNVTNVGTTPVKYFNVRAIYTYDNYVDDGAEFGTGPLVTGQSTNGFIGAGMPHLANGRPAGRLHSVTLIPSLLEFPDGTKWRRPFIHEPTSK